jgi:hypothetical protein
MAEEVAEVRLEPAVMVDYGFMYWTKGKGGQ